MSNGSLLRSTPSVCTLSPPPSDATHSLLCTGTSADVGCRNPRADDRGHVPTEAPTAFDAVDRFARPGIHVSCDYLCNLHPDDDHGDVEPQRCVQKFVRDFVGLR